MAWMERGSSVKKILGRKKTQFILKNAIGRVGGKCLHIKNLK